MIGDMPLPRLADDHGRIDRRTYLDSFKALAACTREFGRLTNGVVDRVGALAASGVDTPVVRRSPGRCIVQLGPVAITLAWLRSTLDSVTAGKLLVIVWRGSVAPRATHTPERARVGAAPIPATVVWEEALVATALDEANWTWQPELADIGGCSSSDLADRCVEQLRLAHAEATDAG